MSSSVTSLEALTHSPIHPFRHACTHARTHARTHPPARPPARAHTHTSNSKVGFRMYTDLLHVRISLLVGNWKIIFSSWQEGCRLRRAIENQADSKRTKCILSFRTLLFSGSVRNLLLVQAHRSSPSKVLRPHQFENEPGCRGQVALHWQQLWQLGQDAAKHQLPAIGRLSDSALSATPNPPEAEVPLRACGRS